MCTRTYSSAVPPQRSACGALHPKWQLAAPYICRQLDAGFDPGTATKTTVWRAAQSHLRTLCTPILPLLLTVLYTLCVYAKNLRHRWPINNPSKKGFPCYTVWAGKGVGRGGAWPKVADQQKRRRNSKAAVIRLQPPPPLSPFTPLSHPPREGGGREGFNSARLPSTVLM